mgnify:CR=1 FL=1
MKKVDKKILKEKTKEIVEQKKAFKEKRLALADKQFIASMHHENTLMGEDGKAHVNVDLTKVDSPFAVYSYNKKMDSDIFSYIEEQVFYLRAEVPVVINFDDGGKYSEETKENISKYVKRHYTLQYEDSRLDLLKSKMFAVLFMIIGVLLLGLYVTLSLTIPAIKENQVIIEIVCILAWVFVWESVDKFVFEGHQNKTAVANSAQLALADITFDKVNTKKKK